jgi:hypothetical protein
MSQVHQHKPKDQNTEMLEEVVFGVARPVFVGERAGGTVYGDDGKNG